MVELVLLIRLVKRRGPRAGKMIGEILEEGRIRLRLQGSTKLEVLKELVGMVGESDEERREILGAVLEREGRMSTGLGKGVAIPRARLPSLPELRGAFGLKPEGVGFESLDEAPAKIFFLLVFPQGDDREYVKALSLLLRVLNQDSFRDDLLRAKNEKEVLDLFREEERSR